jgi:hypothetical protein
VKCKVVVIKVPLYDYDEDDNVHPLSNEVVEEIVGYIKGVDDVAGYSIGSIEVEEEDWNI